MDSIPILLSMHEEGLKVDLVRAARWSNDLSNRLTELGAMWASLTQPFVLAHGAKEVKPLSGPQVQKLLYDWLGMEEQRNKQDGVTVDAMALFDLKRMYPEHGDIITTLEEYRETNKQHSTYAKTLSGLYTSGHDQVHPQYLPGGQEGETLGARVLRLLVAPEFLIPTFRTRRRKRGGYTYQTARGTASLSLIIPRRNYVSLRRWLMTNGFRPRCRQRTFIRLLRSDWESLAQLPRIPSMPRATLEGLLPFRECLSVKVISSN